MIDTRAKKDRSQLRMRGEKKSIHALPAIGLSRIERFKQSLPGMTSSEFLRRHG